jgi:hypothetical protein
MELVKISHDCNFVESCCFYQNLLYIPVTLTDNSLKIYVYNLDSKAIQPLDFSEKDSTCFGSKMTKNGTLWLCIFNKNLLLALDILTQQVTYRIDVSSPNDVCIDKNNDSILYVAGGSFGKKNLFSIPSLGTIYRIETLERGDYHIQTLVKDLPTLSGIDCDKSYIFISELYQIEKIQINNPENREILWNNMKNFPFNFLCDNVCYNPDEDKCTVALYRKLNSIENHALRNTEVSTFGWMCGKLYTITKRYFSCQPPENINDPSIALEISNVDSNKKIAFLELSVKDGIQQVSLVRKKIRQSNIFDGHVTQVLETKSHRFFINFKSKYLLVEKFSPTLPSQKRISR